MGYERWVGRQSEHGRRPLPYRLPGRDSCSAAGERLTRVSGACCALTLACDVPPRMRVPSPLRLLALLPSALPPPSIVVSSASLTASPFLPPWPSPLARRRHSLPLAMTMHGATVMPCACAGAENQSRIMERGERLDPCRVRVVHCRTSRWFGLLGLAFMRSPTGDVFIEVGSVRTS